MKGVSEFKIKSRKICAFKNIIHYSEGERNGISMTVKSIIKKKKSKNTHDVIRAIGVYYLRLYKVIVIKLTFGLVQIRRDRKIHILV